MKKICQSDIPPLIMKHKYCTRCYRIIPNYDFYEEDKMCDHCTKEIKKAVEELRKELRKK